jgi:hypothetical protein
MCIFFALFLFCCFVDFAVAKLNEKGIFKPNNTNDAEIFYLPANSGAKCLDGSLPAYYLRRGFSSGTDKWIVFFEGGGWCYNLQQCLYRSRTILGSSKTYPKLYNEFMKFYISANELENPFLYNWNAVYVRYCDGTSYAGDAVVNYNVFNISYFYFIRCL